MTHYHRITNGVYSANLKVIKPPSDLLSNHKTLQQFVFYIKPHELKLARRHSISRVIQMQSDVFLLSLPIKCVREKII